MCSNVERVDLERVNLRELEGKSQEPVTPNCEVMVHNFQSKCEEFDDHNVSPGTVVSDQLFGVASREHLRIMLARMDGIYQQVLFAGGSAPGQLFGLPILLFFAGCSFALH